MEYDLSKQRRDQDRRLAFQDAGRRRGSLQHNAETSEEGELMRDGTRRCDRAIPRRGLRTGVRTICLESKARRELGLIAERLSGLRSVWNDGPGPQPPAGAVSFGRSSLRPH